MNIVFSLSSNTNEPIEPTSLGYCAWEDVPDFAERQMNKILAFAFPNADFSGTSPIKHFIVASSVLTRPHFAHQHYRKQFEAERVVQVQIEQKFQLAIELGLSFHGYNQLVTGHHKSYVIGGPNAEDTIQLRSASFK